MGEVMDAGDLSSELTITGRSRELRRQNFSVLGYISIVARTKRSQRLPVERAFT